MTITLDGTNGITTPALTNTGTETLVNLTSTGNTTLGDATTDTLTVGVTGIVKDASGNVGIGTASPAGKLDVSQSTAGVARHYLRNTSSSVSAYTILDLVNDSGNNIGEFFCTSSTNTSAFGTNATVLQAATSNPLILGTNGTERMRIDSSGNLLVGTTTTAALPTSTADIVAGGFALNISRRTTGIAGNTYWSPSDGYFYRSTSSLRYKINVQDYSRGLTDIAKLRPVTFNSKPKDGEENPDTNTYAGFIAEEVHDAGLTEYVQYANDGIPESLSYANMVALLTKAIQEQQVLITTLTTRITALEAK
jgi:Chaperone of endosialidase